KKAFYRVFCEKLNSGLDRIHVKLLRYTHYKHTNRMPIDFDLFEKYNPTLSAHFLHQTLASLPSPFKEHVIRRFNIVRKTKTFWERIKNLL
ncbi:MAG: hypothetical protein K2X90_00960, partial [Candidatus Babeliaceae bacterium]|nr:hypothetical protein [Candidatus Babeliaceae bacterium]